MKRGIAALCAERDQPLVAELFRLLDVDSCRCEEADADHPLVAFGRQDGGSPVGASVLFDRLPPPDPHNPRAPMSPARSLRFADRRLPLYCPSHKVRHNGPALLLDDDGSSFGGIVEDGGIRSAVFGYDILGEIEFLMTVGQPEECADTPALDFHLDLLLVALTRVTGRSWESSLQQRRRLLVLTHDVDSPYLRPHLFDATLAGIVARGVKSIVRSHRGQTDGFHTLVSSLRHLVGSAPDPMEGIPSCLAVDKNLNVRSTYFVVARLGTAGRRHPSHTGITSLLRPVKYGKGGLERVLAGLRGTPHEVGLHGIDAWRSAEDAAFEMRLMEEHGVAPKGSRMHWLYWASDTARSLSEAGLAYDSTMGFNSTVGYRCGTARAFRIPGGRGLWELPLIVMDTALFLGGSLSPEEVIERVRPFAQHISENGGVLTINWHERSFSSERPWARHYTELVKDLLSKGFTPLSALDVVTRSQAPIGSRLS